ncbi:FecCD family ABC transporter permease [Candidatus Symbiobacter mobilis]|uniref:Iron complex transporter permease protein n=1 Tax=Candidatus Symbiobacter mobilis CR TaxID=946483 RepID=U5NCS9_9BURK|nr:iron ABC transporter permease [Candidatus Symbiobacter mobilis]AGX87974.1 iron complex transporter permease protein [Candidatus Symbiobacter mobilis CR]
MNTANPAAHTDLLVPARAVYLRQTTRRLLAGGVLLCALLALSLFALGRGSYPLPVSEVLAALQAGPEAQGPAAHVVWFLRLPRLLAAMLAGMALALAGTVMQTALRNPLASPLTLGVSQGAAFGATCAIVLLGAGEMRRLGPDAVVIHEPALVVAAALAGGLGVAGLILFIALLRGLRPEALVLAGVALGAFASAGTMLVQYFADEVQVAATLFWTFGDLSKAGWREVAWLAAVTLPLLLWLVSLAWRFNALAWGEDSARALGVAVGRLRLGGLAAASTLAAVATAFLGVIGFVGLIAPHLVRLAIGADHRYLLPYAALTGAIVLLAADTLGRLVIAPAVLPVGAVTALLGAPMLLALLLRWRMH